MNYEKFRTEFYEANRLLSGMLIGPSGHVADLWTQPVFQETKKIVRDFV